MEGHDKATAVEMCNIPAGQMSGQWIDHIREEFKKTYINYFVFKVGHQQATQRELEIIHTVAGKTFEKHLQAGTLGKVLEEIITNG